MYKFSTAIALMAASTLALADQPKLVLQITVDGLRGDLIERYQNNLSKNGFRYFNKKGAVFTQAHQNHANTETIVGHASLATGAHPSVHGMTGNVWYDHKTGELAYNVEDAKAPLLSLGDKSDEHKAEQVDPTQKAARTSGRSPKALLVPTLSDQLTIHSAGKAKVFAVSGKDRSAIAMAGKTGKALWFSTDSGKFITSQYYYDSYPTWVSQWNNQDKAQAYGGTHWELLLESKDYLLKDNDDRPYETDLKGFGRIFPHTYAQPGNKLFTTQLLVSPAGDKLLLDFTKQLVKSEGLGQDDVTDYLSVSFSSVDAVNHFFGPSSLENEDVVLQMDRRLQELLSFIDKQVGLKNTLVVLSADHGMAEMPEYTSELGYSAKRLHPDDITELANKAVAKELGIKNVSRFFFRPYLYLNSEKISQSKYSQSQVEVVVAKALSEHKGVARAFTQADMTSPEQGLLIERVRNNYHPERSGHIYLAQNSYWFIFESGPIATMHGSPWNYDTHVPLMFAGFGVKKGRFDQTVEVIDSVPTLAAILGMSPPAGASGQAIEEVIKD